MESWKETLTQDMQDTFQELFEHGMQFAEHMLQKYKTFNPFAFGFFDGANTIAGVMPSEETTNAEELIQALIKMLQENKKDFKAIVLVTDVNLKGMGVSAINVKIENLDGFSLSMITPYKIRGIFKRTIEEWKTETFSNEPFIWTK